MSLYAQLNNLLREALADAMALERQGNTNDAYLRAHNAMEEADRVRPAVQLGVGVAAMIYEPALFEASADCSNLCGHLMVVWRACRPAGNVIITRG